MTQIFDSYEAFSQREDKAINGVSKKFATNNPNWEADNATNVSCWNCRYCWACAWCTDCTDCTDCGFCTDCTGCTDCRACRDCRYYVDNKPKEGGE